MDLQERDFTFSSSTFEDSVSFDIACSKNFPFYIFTKYFFSLSLFLISPFKIFFYFSSRIRGPLFSPSSWRCLRSKEQFHKRNRSTSMNKAVRENRMISKFEGRIRMGIGGAIFLTSIYNFVQNNHYGWLSVRFSICRKFTENKNATFCTLNDQAISSVGLGVFNTGYKSQ